MKTLLPGERIPGPRALVADDDPVSLRRLERLLSPLASEIRSAPNGELAWNLFQSWRPEVVLLDWQMPGLSGLDVCQRIRADAKGANTHVILVTARIGDEDLAAGLAGGADDYVRKPVGSAELLARIRSGQRLIALRRALEARVGELEQALSEVKRLEGLVPICAYCKRIRDDRDYWQQLEVFISERTDARFSHGICPDCEVKVRAELRARKG